MQPIIDQQAVYYIAGLAIALIGFFLKSLVTKLDSGNVLLNEIDKHMAVISEKISSYEIRISMIEKDHRKMQEDILYLKSNNHDFAKLMKN